MRAGARAPGRTARWVRRRVNRLGYDITHEPPMYRIVDLLRRNDVDCVLDIGANVGQFHDELRQARFPGRIVSIEPLPAAFSELARRAEQDPLWAAEQCAVADSTGELTVHVAGNSASSSTLAMLDRHARAVTSSRYVDAVTVRAVTVDELVARFGITPENTLLKIDVQGYEDAVLRGASTTLSRFAAVQLELSTVPLYKGQQLLPELWSTLDAAGMEMAFVVPGWVEPESGRMLQIDGLFLRKP